MKKTISKNGKGQSFGLKQKIIPEGNMFLSKKSESYLPDVWPSYYKSAKGCTVEDLDGNKFIDMTMGVGTNILVMRTTMLIMQ